MSRSVRVASVVFLASVLAFGSLRAQDASTKAAQTAVTAWLTLIDNQTYAASWTAAASYFRQRVTQEQWETLVRNVREPFGLMKSRVLKEAKPSKTLPGAPDGNYVVFQFDAAYEHKAAAAEMVVAMQEMDGTWRVAGYSVK